MGRVLLTAGLLAMAACNGGSGMPDAAATFAGTYSVEYDTPTYGPTDGRTPPSTITLTPTASGFAIAWPFLYGSQPCTLEATMAPDSPGGIHADFTGGTQCRAWNGTSYTLMSGTASLYDNRLLVVLQWAGDPAHSAQAESIGATVQ